MKKLQYRDNVSGTGQIFPLVGEWKSGEIKEVDNNQAKLLLKDFGHLIVECDVKPPIVEKPKKIEPISKLKVKRERVTKPDDDIDIKF